MIYVIERFNLKWVSAECDKHKIKYIKYDGRESNYFADFIIDDKYMIECKPKKLIKSVTVKTKSEAAIRYCSENNLKFKILEPRKISLNDLTELYNLGIIKFTEKTKIKYLEYAKKQSNNS